MTSNAAAGIQNLVHQFNRAWLDSRFDELEAFFHEDAILAAPDSGTRLAARAERGGADVVSSDPSATHKGAKHMATKSMRTLRPSQREELLTTLKARFDENMHRHEGLRWEDVRSRLEDRPDKLWSLNEMDQSGGEPDVVDQDEKTGEYVFVDCSAESPKGRRSVCYDRQALEARKKHKPAASAVELADAMGAALLTEEEYRGLHELGEFDAKTSSWLQTPPDIRGLGGAMFGDYRFGTVWIYHNGADSYYAARGFRCALRV